MFTYEVVMVILAILSGLIGMVGKFFWDKMKGYDGRHDILCGKVDELDVRLSSRINSVENRATAIESNTASKEDLFHIANMLREDNVKRDERMYDKLESLASKLEDLRYEKMQ